jgi:serine/threonine protein kinase
MSPERLQNQALSPQSDIFSLASTAFIFLSGVAPFQANSISEHIRARSQQVPALRQVAPHFSEEIEAILQKSLHPDPQERHQTASEFTTALWNALQKMDYQGKASVFISHADIDSDFALQLAESLEANQIGVWLDKKDLSPGQIWEKAIRKAIQETDKFLVLLSPEAVDSRYVQAEMDFALEKEKPIIPIAHRPCEIPLYIRSLQRLDFSLLGYSRGLELLVRALLA